MGEITRATFDWDMARIKKGASATPVKANTEILFFAGKKATMIESDGTVSDYSRTDFTCSMKEPGFIQNDEYRKLRGIYIQATPFEMTGETTPSDILQKLIESEAFVELSVNNKTVDRYLLEDLLYSKADFKKGFANIRKLEIPFQIGDPADKTAKHAFEVKLKTTKEISLAIQGNASDLYLKCLLFWDVRPKN